MSPLRLSAELVTAVRRVLPQGGTSYPLHEPLFGGKEWDYVKSCLDSGWVSSAGAFVGRFEQQICEVTGSEEAIATVNGTAALHLCLLAAGVRPGDEVIVPALTFVATANAVSYCGATPHFADSAETTLGLDPKRLAEHLATVGERRDGSLHNKTNGRRIAAVVVTHVLGHPADLDPLLSLCREQRLPLIEDAAEALGSTYKSRHVGRHGLLAALSFNGNKVLTTGGGGAVITDDEALAERVRHLSTTAKQPHAWRYDHDAVGYNYRMPNINAALGCAQLEQLSGLLHAKRALAARYASALAEVEGLRCVTEPAFARSNYWLNAVLIDAGDTGVRDELLKALHAEGILARPAWTLMHRLPAYAEAPRADLEVAKDIERRLICLPSSASLA